MPPRKGSWQPERLRYQATLLDGEKAADVFPQQFGEALVEVGADGDVTLVARVSGGELGDHALALFHAEKPRADFGELLGRAGEVIAAAGAARRVGAVAEIHAPFADKAREW